MPEGIVHFEVEIYAPSRIRSRVTWPESSGPWIDGGLEELMVHFTYAGWTAYMLRLPMSLMLSSQEALLGQTISDIMTRVVEAMGAVQIGEIRLTREALDQLRRDRIEP
jgi:hypothetical protein